MKQPIEITVRPRWKRLPRVLKHGWFSYGVMRRHNLTRPEAMGEAWRQMWFMLKVSP